METVLYWIKRVIPTPLLEWIRPPYHFLLAWLGARYYHHPSRDITVFAVTGTKGKSTVVEMLSAILRANGMKTASLSTIQFTIDDDVEANRFKMTMPGRFFIQRFLRRAVDAVCTHAVIEMTSEGAKHHRHRFIELDALIFTNLTPEHIEAHGSFENYKNAKLSIAKQLAYSGKQPRYIVANADSEHGVDFLTTNVEEQLPYSLKDLKLHTLHRDGVGLIFIDGDEEITIRVPMPGISSVYNALAAITLARAIGISFTTIERALRTLPTIRGRLERLTPPEHAEKHITAIVDYAHTPDSLQKLYETFTDKPKVCVLGNTGGGRDTWKRPEMARIAEQHCDYCILTNEDPYDEDPRKIVEEMAAAFENPAHFEIIMDRRLAIREAITRTKEGGYVIVSGKGTDPYIMGPNNTKEPWSDAEVVQEELDRLGE